MHEFKNTILLQGPISKWTKHIVKEYSQKHPDAQILISTWTNENIDDIPCEVIFSEPPCITKPFKSTVNYQIVGTQAGLKKVKGKQIMKCRTDQFIHNKEIFHIFENFCPIEKIMIPNLGTYEQREYRTSDFCQVATKSNLLEFWEKNSLFDGKNPIDGGTYLTENYVLNIKNEKLDWKKALRKYFFVIDFHKDFQIEWEKINYNYTYQETYSRALQKRVITDLGNI
jgi:hypothetical protein